MSESTTVKKDEFGIDQILKVLFLIVEGANVRDKVLEAKTITGRLMALIPLADEIGALISLNVTLLNKQRKDISTEEWNQILHEVRNKFSIDDDDLESRIEVGLELIHEGFEFFGRAYSWAKSLMGNK